MDDFGQKKSALKCYIPNDVTLQLETTALLCTIIREIHSNFVNAILNNVENASEIGASIVQESIKPLIPENLRRYAFANACRHVALYQSGLLTHEEKAEAVEPVTVNFKDGVKRILQDFNSSAGRGFMPYINGYLNDICHALAEESSLSAQKNNRVLTDIDVLNAVNDFLPEDLKQHAFARIYHLQKHGILPSTSNREQPESTVSNYLFDMASRALGGGKVRGDETQEESKSKSFLDVARVWISPTTTENLEGNELAENEMINDQNESVRSEEIRSDKVEEKEYERKKSVLVKAWEWISPSTEKTESIEQTENKTSGSDETVEK